MRAGHRPIAAGLALTLVCTGCFGGSHRDASTLQVTKVTGSVSARTTATGPWTGLAQGGTVGPGSSVRVAPGGSVVLARGDHSSVELRPGSPDPAELTVGETAGDLSIASGDVLVTTDPSAPISVGAQGMVARTTAGIFRLDLMEHLRIGSYDGSIAVSSDTSTLPPLARYNEWLLNPRVAPIGQPYGLNVDDPWDRRLLADAVETENQVGPLATGYDARFGARTAAAALAPIATDARRSIGFVNAWLAATGGSDVLIALAFSLLLERKGKGRAATSFASMSGLRRRGAAWGLIAHEQGLLPRDAVGVVVCAISLRSGDARPGEGCFRSTAPGSTPSPTPTPTPTLTPTPPPTHSPTPTHSPSATGSPTPTNRPPSAGFTDSCSDLTCQFTDTSTDRDGHVVTWNWSFGDSTSSSSQNPSHTYSASGTYTVTLRVTDDDGAGATVSHQVTVTAPCSDIDRLLGRCR